MLAKALRELIGAEQVLDDEASLARAATATFATSARPRLIARPDSRDQLRAVLEVARRHSQPVYAVSGGRNWGLGSRVPTVDGAILLELSRMDRIVGFDEELAFVTVEPGVTFQQLYEFLAARGSRLFANTTGASPLASVVGNALERGDGAGPTGDRIQHVAAIEAVLSTGEVVTSGFGRFGETPLAPLHRLGVGPSIDGLLSQSGLAIVTRLTLWLTPLPRSLSAVRFRVKDARRLGAIIDVLRELRLDGTLRSIAGLWNDYRVLSTHGQYPWHATGGQTPLGRDVLSGLSSAWGGATWFGVFALYAASAAQGRAHEAHVRALLGPTVDELTLDAREGEPRSGAELLDADEPAFRFLQGIPHSASLHSTYFRKRSPVPSDPDPDRDRCGVMWCCPCLPLRGADALAAVEIAETTLLEHGFEPLLALLAQTERTAYLVPLLTYDRDVAGEDERARVCHDALLARFIARGYLPYRLGVQSMDVLPPSADDTDALLARIETAFDPASLIAPGRYASPKGVKRR